MPEDKSQLVQMRLQPRTIERIQYMSELTGGTKNRTQIVSSSIELANEILKSIKEGSNIYIETKDGKKELLKIIGI